MSIFISYIITINLIAYLTMIFDKYQSLKKESRIAEKNLFALAFVGGALGVYFGMKAPLYHKASKAKFKWGIPLLIAFNIVCLYFLFSSQLFAF